MIKLYRSIGLHNMDHRRGHSPDDRLFQWVAVRAEHRKRIHRLPPVTSSSLLGSSNRTSGLVRSPCTLSPAHVYSIMIHLENAEARHATTSKGDYYLTMARQRARN